MRQSWEKNSVAAGLNSKTDGAGNPYPGASSAAGTYSEMFKEYRETFCDPNSNGGHNRCLTTIPKFRNADVRPMKFIYSALTIPVDPADNDTVPENGQRMARTVNAIINNMVGVPAMDPIPESALKSPAGKSTFMQRRSYLARYAAIRSVPNLVASWRMPGSQMGDWINQIENKAGADPDTLSKNPSYKEIMHAISVDRFHDGAYAAKMLTEDNKVQLEKLNISVFYLMQLRDYYELLERTALTLAVQVSLLAEEQQHALPNIYVNVPLH
jgi:hypothetical protein